MPALGNWVCDGGGSDALSVRKRIAAYLKGLGIDPAANPAEARVRTRGVPDAGVNTSLSDYVRLPLRFDAQGNVRVRREDEWSPADYE